MNIGFCESPSSGFSVVAPNSIYILFPFLFLFYFDLLFSKTRQHLRCNLLLGLIGHFGLLKGVNISFFLSLNLFLFLQSVGTC